MLKKTVLALVALATISGILSFVKLIVKDKIEN